MDRFSYKEARGLKKLVLNMVKEKRIVTTSGVMVYKKLFGVKHVIRTEALDNTIKTKVETFKSKRIVGQNQNGLYLSK